MTDATSLNTIVSTLCSRFEAVVGAMSDASVQLSMPMTPSARALQAGSGVLLLVVWLGAPGAALAHAKGLYKTQAEAEQRAKQLGCQGTHQNNGHWMPCADEATLHRQLRQQ